MAARNLCSWMCARTTNGPRDIFRERYTSAKELLNATSRRRCRIPGRKLFCIAAADFGRRSPRTLCSRWDPRTSSRWTADGRAGTKRDFRPRSEKEVDSRKFTVESEEEETPVHWWGCDPVDLGRTLRSSG